MSDNNSATPIFDLNQFEYKVNYALEASAGTGKTYSITEMVRRLLLDYKLGLDKILIVTYTEKAAGELKNRIREVLTKPNDKLGGKSIKDYLNGEVNCDVDNASIGTIHSFCKNTIKEFAISADQPQNLDLAGDTSIVDFACRYIREGKILEDITELLSIDCVIDEYSLVNSFVAIVNRYYLDLNYEEDESVIVYYPTYKEDQLELLPFLMFRADDPISVLKEKDSVKYDCYVLLKQSTSPQIQEFVTLFENFSSFCGDKRGISAFKITQKAGCSKAEVDAFKTLFELKKEFDSFSINAYLIDKYVKDFYKSYQEYKAANRLQSFNDMIRMVRESILEENSKLLECLKKKFSYAIIDEFQDTNQIQFDIFSRIFMSDDDHNIIVVGDPKQSIYSYQGADVKVYQKAVEEISAKGKKCRLAKNYRSSAGVVEFGNALFTNYEFETGFEPSSYCLLSNGEKERRIKYKGKYSSGLWLNNQPLEKEEFAKFAVCQILDCTSLDENGNTNLQKSYIDSDGNLKYKNVSFSDFVVLARTRTEMPYIQQALKNAGIPNVRYKDDSLFCGIECAHWIALLEAIDVVDFTGYNRGYFKKALFTKFFDLPLSEISKEIYDDDDNPQIQLMNKWRAFAKERLWEDLFDTIIIDSELDKRMSSLSELQSLAMFKQISNYAVDYLSDGHDITSLIKHLKSMVLFGDEDSDDEKASLVAKSTEFNCVRIMTMHASKGLQFPVVISVGGLRGPKPTNDAYSCHHEFEDGTIRQVVSLQKLDEANEEQIDEFFRLFYVAYTRSEFLLIAPRYGGKDDRLSEISSQMETFIKQYDGKTFDVDNEPVEYYQLKDFEDVSYNKLRAKTKAILSQFNIQNDSDQIPHQEEVLKKLIKDKKDKIAYKHSYSSLAHPEKIETEEEIIDEVIDLNKEGEADESIIQFDTSAKQILGKYDDNLNSLAIPDGYPKGAGMGNAIHEVFEMIDFTNHSAYLENVILDRFSFQGFDLKNNTEWLEYSKGLVISTLDAVLPEIVGNKATGAYFKLNSLSNNDKKPEIEFNFNYPNEVLKNYLTGFIDLLFKRGEVYSILDWKSDTLNDDFVSYGDPAELKKHVDERYSIQRVLYSYCLIKWLKLYYQESEEEIFNNHFGGIYYAFVRGCNKDTSNGVYAQTWECWADLEKEFNLIIGADKEE